MKCLYPNCSKPAKNRGLCSTCYMHAYRLCAAGKTSMEELVATGKIKSADGSGSRGMSFDREMWFTSGVPKPPKKVITFDEAIELTGKRPTTGLFVGDAGAAIEVDSYVVIEWLKLLKERQDSVEFGLDGDDGSICFGSDIGDGLVK